MPIDWASMSIFKRTADVNLWGVIEVTKTFLPLIKKVQGRVVNFSSVCGKEFTQQPLTNLHAAFMARYLAPISCRESAFVTILLMKYPHFHRIILVTLSSLLGGLLLPPPAPYPTHHSSNSPVRRHGVEKTWIRATIFSYTSQHLHLTETQTHNGTQLVLFNSE